ncbi:MAG: hypothetical protein AAGE52_32910 [Myxococcota bacterium]
MNRADAGTGALDERDELHRLLLAAHAEYASRKAEVARLADVRPLPWDELRESQRWVERWAFLIRQYEALVCRVVNAAQPPMAVVLPQD